MGYIQNSLISGESVTYRANLHWVIFLKPLLVTLFLVALAVLLLYAANQAEPQQASILEWIGAGLLVTSLIPLVAAAIKRRSAEFAVTNKRVILKIGAVNNRTAEMFLNKIESVGVDQTLGGKILGYGSIVIRGTGGSLEPFHRISSPLEFRKQIQEQIGQSFEPTPRTTNRS